MSAPPDLAGSLARHARVALQFVRIGLIRKTQFRFEFAVQVLMDCTFYATHVLTFEILFAHTESIAGWTPPEVRVFLGFLFCADAYYMTFLGQAWHFGRELKDGALDPLRVRPGSPVFLYFFQRFGLEGATNGVIALAYLGWALVQAPGVTGALPWLLVPWALALACVGRTVLTVLLSINEFYLVNSDLARFWEEALGASSDNPLDVFGRRVRAFLILALPIGFLAHLPAALVLGRMGLLAGLAHTAWIAGFGWLVTRWWRAGFRRYESALG